MKILHVVQCYDPAVGGSEWLTKNLSEQFVHRYGDEVTVFTTAATRPVYFWRAEGEALPAGTESINGVTVRRFRVFRGLRLLRMLIAHTFHRFRLPFHDWARTIQVGPLVPGLADAIAASGADIVLATSFPFMHMYDAIRGAKRGRIPVVLLGAIHTADRWGYDRKMMYDAIRKADAYIAHTTYERDHVVARDVSEHKVRVIGAGVDMKQFLEADGLSVRRELGWGTDDLVIVDLARQTVLKSLDTLLLAMPKVWARMPGVRLLLAGARTSYSSHLDQIIESYPGELRPNVKVINDFADSEKASLLAAADLFVHPSGNESFGIVLVEAWASGRAVVGADVGAISSVIDDGVNGRLFQYRNSDDLAQVILELLENRQVRQTMGEVGRQTVLSDYTWDAVADRVRSLYEEVLQAGGSQESAG